MISLPPPRSLTRLLLVSVLAGLVAAASWWVWLGWDHTYYQVDGAYHGPYRAWQVVGCALTVATVGVVARRWARHPVGLVVLPLATVVGFAVSWSTEASSDVTGLWVIGLGMLVVGGFLGLFAVVLVTDAVLQTRDRKRAGPATAH